MSLFDGLSDYEAGRCADCRHHRGASNCRGCEYQDSTDVYMSQMNREWQATIAYDTRREAQSALSRLNLAKWINPRIVPVTGQLTGRRMYVVFAQDAPAILALAESASDNPRAGAL